MKSVFGIGIIIVFRVGDSIGITLSFAAQIHLEVIIAACISILLDAFHKIVVFIKDFQNDYLVNFIE